jgi:hypothetical protein
VQWRIAELEAGRGDPGRQRTKKQVVVFIHSVSCLSVLGIRWLSNHTHTESKTFMSILTRIVLASTTPTSQKTFPTIDTLLSIPFSLLHTLPRLAGAVPISHYQQLVAMGAEISRLWWWDPPPDMIRGSDKILQNVIGNRQDNARQAKPDPIHHPSSLNTTFVPTQPITTYGVPTTHSTSHNTRRSGQILLGTTPSLFWDRDGILLTPGEEELARMEDMQRVDKGIVDDVTTPPLTSEAWDVRTHEGCDDFDDIDHDDIDEEESSAGCPPSFDIIPWYDKIVDSASEPLPLAPASFERGVIAPP